MIRSETRESLLLVGAVLLGLCAPACGPSRSASSDPGRGANVLLITVDTLRADELHCYGSPHPVSPSLDAIASRGVLFERAISAASYTAPSHASIMTGLYPREHSLGYGNGTTRLGPEERLAEYLSQAGYDTAAFVSNPVLNHRIGLDRGFSVYDDHLDEHELNRPHRFERTAPRTTERALAWLAGHHRRFFLWVHYQDPHGPYTPPPPFDHMFAASGPDGPGPELPVLNDNHGQGGIPAYQRLPGLSRLGQYRALYRGEIRGLDDSIGALVAAAEKRGPTFVVITADHGEAFGENGFFLAHGHACTPDQSHVPLIVTGPNVEPQRRTELVGHVDIMPTVLDLVGLQPPDDRQGRSLRDALVAGAPLPQRTYFCDAGFELDAYRGESFLRARQAPWSADLDDQYKRGWANADDALVDEESVGSLGAFEWKGTGPWRPATMDQTLLEKVYAYWQGPSQAGERVAIPSEDLERLRALGYVEPNGSRVPTGRPREAARARGTRRPADVPSPSPPGSRAGPPHEQPSGRIRAPGTRPSSG